MDNKLPTDEEYGIAKKIVIIYEAEQQRLKNLRLESFKKDLSNLFLNNEQLIIKEFRLDWGFGCYNIIPINPNLEGCYDGELDDEIKLLCKKHKIKASIIYWCYDE